MWKELHVVSQEGDQNNGKGGWIVEADHEGRGTP